MGTVDVDGSRIVELLGEPRSDGPVEVNHCITQPEQEELLARLEEFTALADDSVPQQHLQQFASDSGADGMDPVAALEQPERLMPHQSLDRRQRRC